MANLNLKKTQLGSKASPTGKGTWTRKTQVPADEFARNWERTFGRRRQTARARRP